MSGLRKVVVSTDPAFALEEDFERAASARDAIALLQAHDVDEATLAGGSILNTSFAREQLIDAVEIHIEAVRHFLYAAARGGSRVQAVKLGALGSTETRVLLADASSKAMYADGFLVFLRETTLMAQPFDPSSLTLHGEPRPLAEHVQINPTTGTGAFTVSQQGVLAYQASTHGEGTMLVWRNRSGERIRIVGEAAGYMDVRLAPDGRRASVAVAAPERRASDLYLFDLVRHLRTRFTFGPDPASGGVWSPTGDRIAYTVLRKAGHSAYRSEVDGSSRTPTGRTRQASPSSTNRRHGSTSRERTR